MVKMKIMVPRQTQKWDKRRSGQTQDFWDKRRSGQTQKSQTLENFFFNFELFFNFQFFYTTPNPLSVQLFFLVRLG